MSNVNFLRDRAARYRRLADAAKDKDVADSCRLLAEIDEQEVHRIENHQKG
ncbi:MAG TPA: hypothetical protein VN802_16405 [Stellaceae bacterium]|nr:hypothetical protein [Stellaceae bacterium]